MLLGTTRIEGAHAGPAGREVIVYLRPEDVLARPIAQGEADVFEACIEAIEFLGSYCQVSVSVPALGPQPLQGVLSLNFLAEQSLQVGSWCRWTSVLPTRCGAAACA